MAFLNPRRLMRTPGFAPEKDEFGTIPRPAAPPLEPGPREYPFDYLDVKEFFDPVKPLSGPERPIYLPEGAPPLEGAIVSPRTPPALERPAPIPMPARMPETAAPNRIAPTSLPTPMDYRGRPIADTEDFERNQFMRKGAKEDAQGNLRFKRNWKDTLIGAGLGALRGLGTGQGIGAAIGGALGGAAVPLISPRLGREGIFEATQAPFIREQMAKQQQQVALQRQAGMDALKQRQIESQIGLTEAQTRKTGMPAPVRPVNVPRGGTLIDPATGRVIYEGAPPIQRPISVQQGATLIDPTTGQPLFTAPPKPERAPTAAELDIDPESGLSSAEMAEASFQKRGGEGYVKERLPANLQKILNTGKVTRKRALKNPKNPSQPLVDEQGFPLYEEIEDDATPQEISSAQNALRQAVADAKRTDVEYSKGHIRKKVLGRKGGAAPLSKPEEKSSTSRPRSSFNSSKFPGLKFD